MVSRLTYGMIGGDGNGPLADIYPGPHTHIHMKVAEIIENGIWNLNSIDHIVDNTTRNEILGTALPLYVQASDQPTWVNATNGLCSSTAAYDLLNSDSNDLKGWKWFWKIKLPQKFKSFLWLIFHNKLPTNLLRARRGITTSDLCPRCNSSPESLNHLFRECHKASLLWETIPSGRTMRDRFTNTFSDWISLNVKKEKILHFGTQIPWNTLFCTTHLANLEGSQQKKF